MRSLYAFLLILALMPSSNQNDAHERWRIWTEAITDDLLNDARQLPTLRHAELLTRLGHRWWLYDQGRAAGWFGDAIDIVEQAPKNETTDERGQRLETARLMLKFIIIFDEKLSGSLITLLSNKEKTSDSERIENADALIEAASTVAQFDPKRGAELGALALRLGPPNEHYRNGRIDEMNLILNGVPSDLQPFAKIGFVASLFMLQQQPIEPELALKFLNDARAGLRRSSLPDIEKYDDYFALMRLLVKYDPPSASAVFKQGVASLNRAEQMKENKNFKLLDYGGLARTLPMSLIEMDETTVKEGIASIASVESRVQLRLELLSETLRRTRAPGVP